MAERRRPCRNCGRNRAERFYSGQRGRVCSFCKKGRTALANRAVRLEETYGLTHEDYQALLAAQGGVCAICGGRRSYNLDVDHCHVREREGLPVRDCVRGLLCRQCNRRVLRSVRDSVEVLEAAIRYLNDPPAARILVPENRAGSQGTMSHSRAGE